jgi:hypothetical protein
MGLPLHVSQVLEDEYEELHGPLPHGQRSWLLRPAHLVAAPALVAALRDRTDGVSSALRGRLSAAVLDRAVTVEALIDALNALLTEPRPLYDLARLPESPAVSAMRELLDQHPSGDDLVHVNRLLLELAYPALIVPIHDARLAAIWHCIHLVPGKRAALCLSGGGIRSATFALGVIQGLARAGLLQHFHYLSTVSGGGFIGSWLTAWSHRHAGGGAGVSAALAAPPEAGLTPEPREVHRLRDYSNYLSPRLGLFSADTWTLAGIYLRNLLLNWLVLVPLLAAVLALPRLVVAWYRAEPGEMFGPWWGDLVGQVMLALGFVLSVMALAYIGYERPSHGQYRRRSQGQPEFLARCLAPLVVAAFALTLYWTWRGPASFTIWTWALFALFGGALHLCAFAVYSIGLRHWDRINLGVIVGTGILGGLVAALVAGILVPQIDRIPQLDRALAVPLVFAAILLAATLYVGLASRQTSDEDREWWARSGAWMLIAMAAWAALCGVVIWAAEVLAEVKTWVASVGGLAAVITVGIGNSARTSAPKTAAEVKGWRAVTVQYAPILAAPVLAGSAAVLLALGTDWLLVWLALARRSLVPRWATWAECADTLPSSGHDHAAIIACADAGLILVLIALLILVGIGMSLFVDVNKFSLHAMYRNRLIRAYLGASRPNRRPNPFTGFDPDDNVPMRDLRAVRPLHVVNMALNLVAGDKLAWQERKAETFTTTALHAGSYHVGYRPTDLYGGADGITLGTAAAISGAAASPNMGYHSSPAVTFLMTLFNARLGWWLGNPGVHGATTHTQASPRAAFRPIVEEALGLTNDRRPYVYLSDGGHFDNLGLLEMVLRRCHVIVVSDAGCDPACGLDDFGAAIRKIRIDLGVAIEMEDMKIRARGKGAGAYGAVGRIRYSEVDGTPKNEDGWLLYIKPALYGREPTDICAYAQRNEAFPQETTTDQWFSESQFESYRRLGAWEIEKLLGAGAATLADLVTRARAHVAAIDHAPAPATPPRRRHSAPGRRIAWLGVLVALGL